MVHGMGFSLKSLSILNSAMIPVGMLLTALAGWVADRFHPLRVVLLTSTISIPFYFFWYYLHDLHIAGVIFSTFTLWTLITVVRSPINAIAGVVGIPLIVRLYPGKQYGQFCSAAAMFRSFWMISGTAIGAVFVDWKFQTQGPAGYRAIFLWQGIFHILGVCCLWVVYVIWKRHGAENFKFDPEDQNVPAGGPEARGFEVLPKKTTQP